MAKYQDAILASQTSGAAESGAGGAAAAFRGSHGSTVRAAGGVSLTGSDVADRRKAWGERICFMAYAAYCLAEKEGRWVEESAPGLDAVLIGMTKWATAMGVENAYVTKALEVDLLRFLVLSNDPNLPMPPKLSLGANKSPGFGKEGYKYSQDRFP